MMNTELMELKIETTLPGFVTNFEELKMQVQERLKKYDIAVSIENLPEAKKLAAELNFFAKKINAKRVEKQKEASAPIEILKSQADELISLFNEGREKLLAQVKVFEDEKRNLCLKLLQEELETQYQATAVEEEFKSIKIDDLAILSNLTVLESLSKKAKNEITTRMNHALATQMMVKSRLLNLENACFKAGLKSLLERKHIESFLKEPEEIYNTNLQNLLETEVKRQAEIEARLLKQVQKEVKPETPAQKIEQEVILNSAPVVASEPSKAKPSILDELEEPSNQRFTITAHFEIECTGETAETLKQKYWNKLSGGFKSIKNIEVSII